MARLGAALLALALTLVATPAGAAPSPSGSPVTGGSSASAAVRISPGQYRDRFERGSDVGDDGTVRYYRVSLSRGDTPYLSATLFAPAGRQSGNLAVTVRLADAAGTDGCEDEQTQTAHLVGGVIPPTSVVLSAGEVGGTDWPDACPTSGDFVYSVVRSGTLARTSVVTGEVALRIEPPATTAGLPGPASAPPAVATSGTLPAPPTAAGSVQPGEGPDDAADLRPGTRSVRASTGSVGWFRVHLDWGQRLSVRVHLAKVAGAGFGDSVPGALQLANPLRLPLDDATSGADVDATSASIGDESVDLTARTPVPVRYTNRDSADADTQAYAIDGDYLLAVVIGHPYSADTKDFAVGYRITLAVSGADEPAPSYGARAGSAATAVSGGRPWWQWAVLGAVIVAALLAGVLLLRRRQSRHT